MKFTIPKAPLVSVLGRIQGITAGRSTMPILNCVLIEPCTGVLRITATDLECGYTTVVDGIEWLDGLFLEAVSLALPAKKLYECAKAIPANTICFYVDEETRRCTISGGTASFTLAGQDPTEYPALPEVAGDQIDLDASALLKLLSAVDYAQSKDPAKYNICSCLLRIEEAGSDLIITAAATDGHRLAIDNISLPGDPRPVPKDLNTGIIVASKGISELRKISIEGIIVIAIAGNNLLVATENEKLYIRLVDGQYPDVNRVIPKDLPCRAEVSRNGLIDAMERVRILSDQKTHRTRLGLAEGGIAISSETADIGTATDTVTAGITGEPFDLYINANYLIEALEAMSGSYVEIRYSTSATVITVNPLGADKPLAIIMQQRGEE